MIRKLPGEIWKDVPGYEGFYKISNRGRLIHIKKSGMESLVKPIMYKNKRRTAKYYKLVTPNKKVQRTAARIMYEAFIGGNAFRVRLRNNKTNLENIREVFLKKERAKHYNIRFSDSIWDFLEKADKYLYSSYVYDLEEILYDLSNSQEYRKVSKR